MFDGIWNGAFVFQIRGHFALLSTFRCIKVFHNFSVTREICSNSYSAHIHAIL